MADSRSSPAVSSSISSRLSAFRLSGRLSVIRAAGSSASTSRCSKLATLVTTSARLARVNSPLTPVSFLERTAAAFPQRVGVIDGERRLTWAEVRERARRLALGLQQAGIGRGDRVAYLAFNTTELLEAHFGVPRAGAVLVAINTRLTADEIDYILRHSGS